MQRCGDHPFDCAQEITMQTMRCFFEKKKPPTRACLWSITTLGSASAMLRLIHMNLPPTVTEEDPWDESHVAMIMIGAWDGMTQRDPRDLCLGEVGRFFGVVKELRRDPRTAKMRILLDMSPPSNPRSTGWRSNHAIAAVHAYVHREVNHVSRHLGVELLSPSYFQMALPRRFELAGNDNTHYIKLFPGENGPTGRDPVTGVKNQCLGDVGQAFLRVMLDRICGGG